MNLHVLCPEISLTLILAIIPPAAAAHSPTPEEVKQWIQQCEIGYEQGQYSSALATCQRAVDALQSLPERPIFASALNNLAEVHRAQGSYSKAEPLYLRSLKIREKALGLEHPSVATSLNNLAEIYRDQGNFSKAESLHLRSLRIREKALGSEHPAVAESLNNLALLYTTQGYYAKAERLLLRSLQIWEEALGPEHPYVATGLDNLAGLYIPQSNNPKAEQLLLRSLKIREKALGPEHPEVATGLNNLALLYQAQGNDSKAEPLHLRSLRILENVLGPEHRDVAQNLNNLALLYQAQGNDSKAEPLYLRSLRIKEKALGLEHRDVAQTLNNLAALYTAQHNYSKAEPLYLRSLQIWEKALGPEHPDVAQTLNNLAALYHFQTNYPKAEQLLLRSLQIEEKALGLEHPQVAHSLQNLAVLYHFQNSDLKAEQLLLRSLRIDEKALGPEHPEVAITLDNLALLDLAHGQPALALPRFNRTLGIRERTLRAVATESRITSLLDKIRGGEDTIYSLLLLKDAPDETRALALRVSLLRKGRAAEAGLMTGWAIQSSLTNDEQRQRFARWQMLRSQNEALFLHGPTKLDDATRQAHRAQLAMLNNQIDDLEHELVRTAPQLTQWKLPEPEQILAQVAARLSAGSALVEVLWFNPFQFQAVDWQHRWGVARYVALLLFPDQRIEFVDLGNAEEMDQEVRELLAAVRDLSQEPLRQAQALYQKIIAPLLAKLPGIQKMYLSSDGSLNLIPYAALHDGHQYLLDTPYQILYLSSGRDLLRGALGHSQQTAVVIADPDFDSTLSPSQSGSRTMDVDTRGLYDGLASMGPLKGARAEGTFVGDLLRVPPILGAAATEERLRQVRSPFILHIATHGLFLNSVLADDRGTRAAMVGARPDDTFNHVTGRISDRSLSRSALVLAGAAHAAAAPDAANDGLLTAEEARSLSLFGTQLVVLSACDTGRGAVKAGQGVYGLRRAFLAAGAETVVMSLWPVSDLGTQSLMQRYYQLLLDDKAPRGRIGALTEAMKAVKAERPHPYYWAPFIANGVDAPLHAPARSVVQSP